MRHMKFLCHFPFSFHSRIIYQWDDTGSNSSLRNNSMPFESIIALPFVLGLPLFLPESFFTICVKIFHRFARSRKNFPPGFRVRAAFFKANILSSSLLKYPRDVYIHIAASNLRPMLNERISSWIKLIFARQARALFLAILRKYAE